MRSGESRAGEVRQAEREGRPLFLTANSAASSVRLCDRVDDREAEADAAVRARPRCVRA